MGLLTIADTVERMVAVHFKLRFMRPRPAQIYPAIMPMILTARHPSYPNAHALQSHLVAMCAQLVVPEGLHEPISVLADRIGENRKIAGLHFPSDTAASINFAPEVMAILAKGQLFKEVVDEARHEWAGLTTGPDPMLNSDPEPASSGSE